MNDILAHEICEKAKNYGYDDCAIIALPELNLPLYENRVTERIQAVPPSDGFYGPILDAFTHIRQLYPWAKALVIAKFWLGQFRYPKELQGRYGKAFLLAPDTAPQCEAWQKRLKFEQWLSDRNIRFDCGPMPRGIAPMRWAAVMSGLGIFRRNNFFYDDKGSWHQLDGFLIDQECELLRHCEVKPCPPKCSLCQKGCPTSSLSAPYVMNPLTCVSFITTFGEGRLPHGLDPNSLKDWICGCDACQDICPFNRSHDWERGENFSGLDSLLELLEPKNLIAAPDSVLKESVIPKADFHLRPDQTQTLRICAKRALSYEEWRKTGRY